MNILLWAPHGAGDHYWGPGMSAYRLYKDNLPKNVKLYLAHGYKYQLSLPNVFTKCYFISPLGKKSKLSQVLFLLKSYFWIKQNYHRFDIVHVLGAYETSFRPALWLEQCGVPAIIKITGDKGGISGSSKLSKFLGFSRSRINNINRISGYIAISGEIKKNLLKTGVVTEKIHSIPNGVDSEKYRKVGNKQKKELRKKLNINDIFTIIFVGGLSTRKQPLMLVKSVHSIINNIGTKIQLLLIGPDRDGKTLGIIKKYIKDNKLQDIIIPINHSNQPYIYYQAADLFCLPSKSEGMSNSLLEAMSSGLPSIVTPISGSIDLIQNGKFGRIITNKNEMIESIMFYYNNPELAIQHGEDAMSHILEYYNKNLVLDKHLKLFTSILERISK